MKNDILKNDRFITYSISYYNDNHLLHGSLKVIYETDFNIFGYEYGFQKSEFRFLAFILFGFGLN